MRYKESVMGKLSVISIDITNAKDRNELRSLVRRFIRNIPSNIIAGHEFMNSESPSHAIDYHEKWRQSLEASINFCQLWSQMLISELFKVPAESFMTEQGYNKLITPIKLWKLSRTPIEHCKKLIHNSRLFDILKENQVPDVDLAIVLCEVMYNLDKFVSDYERDN